MNESQQDQPVSDYEAEWDREDAPDDDQGVDTTGVQQTDIEDPASEESAPETTDETTPIETQDDPAEDAVEGNDGTDGAADSERLRQLETENLSLKGQLKALNDRLSIRGRELKELRQELAENKKANREPTGFEREFPEFAEDIRKLAGTQEETVNEQVDPVDQEAATMEALLAAHPDAGNIYADPALHEWLATEPMFVLNGQPMFVNNAIHSDNADEIIAAISHYKSQANTPAPEPEKNPLEDMTPPPTSQGKPTMVRTPSTPQEEYDAAWASDEL